MSNSQRLKQAYLLSCPNEVTVFILTYCLQHPGFIIYHLSKSLQPNYGRDHKLEAILSRLLSGDWTSAVP
jgi:hypothetical protein